MPRMLEILKGLPRRDGPLFPLSNMAMLQLLRGMRPGVVPHGFRSTFRTWSAERTNICTRGLRTEPRAYRFRRDREDITSEARCSEAAAVDGRVVRFLHQATGRGQRHRRGAAKAGRAMRRRPQAEGEEKYNLNVEGGVVVFPDGRKFRMYESRSGPRRRRRRGHAAIAVAGAMNARRSTPRAPLKKKDEPEPGGELYQGKRPRRRKVDQPDKEERFAAYARISADHPWLPDTVWSAMWADVGFPRVRYNAAAESMFGRFEWPLVDHVKERMRARGFKPRGGVHERAVAVVARHLKITPDALKKRNELRRKT